MSNSTRQLAAIMFTDIVGYTELMGDDEEKGFSVLNKNRSIQRPVIEKHKGFWHKELGDGVLASFKTATDAVQCSYEIQTICKKEKDFKIRIGIHLGEVIFEHNDVFGDGVNIASRIQEKAPPGSIYISESVYRNIQNKKGIGADFVKEEFLKNIKHPIKIYEINEGGRKRPGLPHSKKSIAILPFVNMSTDPEQEFFCDGISEEIINTIVQFPDIKVSARTSSFSFKGKKEDLRIIGQKLGVGNILEGSVRKSGNKIRVTAQLLEATTGFHLWSKKYDRELHDVFVIQDEIALEIANHLKSTLSGDQETPYTRNHTQNFEAYQQYFKGRALFFKRGAEIKEAIACFENALNLDPKYALAYSGLADTYVMFGFWGIMAPKDCWGQALIASNKASQLDPDSSETCTTRAIIDLLYHRNYSKAEVEFERAINLNPTNTQARIWYGLFYLLTIKNDIDKGLEQCKLATEYDPLSSYAFICYAWAFIYAKDVESAIPHAEYSLKLDQNGLVAHNTVGYCNLLTGDLEGALKEFKICHQISNKNTHILFLLYSVYNKMDQPEMALKIYNEIEKNFENSLILPTSTAMAAAFIGKEDIAIKALKAASEIHDPSFPWHLGAYYNESRPLAKLKDFKKIILDAGIPRNNYWFEPD